MPRDATDEWKSKDDKVEVSERPLINDSCSIQEKSDDALRCKNACYDQGAPSFVDLRNLRHSISSADV